MNHISLFSGMGGFDLAAEWMGWNNVAHCEWKPFNQRILKYYWPEAISYHDITKSDFTIHRGTIDILTGGFPCQPYSQAGKRKGKEDDRHLWPEMLRAIREIQPTWIVGENVSGLINWNGGMVFDEVQSEMEAEGYEVIPFILPACGVNAPHRRDRVWFIAYSNLCADRNIRKQDFEANSIPGINREEVHTRESTRANSGNASNSDEKRFQWGEEARNTKDGAGKGSAKVFFERYSERNGWDNFPTQPSVCFRNDGISSKLDGITFSKWRIESIMSGGNAIVPQVALQIFKSIQQFKEL